MNHAYPNNSTRTPLCNIAMKFCAEPMLVANPSIGGTEHMRFFTRSWQKGELDDEAADRVFVDYKQHVDTIRFALPNTVQMFIQNISIHDGLIREVVINRAKKELILRLCCGYAAVGNFNLDITYSGTSLEIFDAPALRNAANNPRTELLFDEFDLDHLGRVVHSIICYPEHELSITFESFQYKVTPRADRIRPRPALVREIS